MLNENWSAVYVDSDNAAEMNSKFNSTDIILLADPFGIALRSWIVTHKVTSKNPFDSADLEYETHWNITPAFLYQLFTPDILIGSRIPKLHPK